ncbi:MAG: glycosyltransferase [Defluviitaleaceae bacterium]|nr:glycosyltransferase [Defluviitaleaceae bacterium]
MPKTSIIILTYNNLAYNKGVLKTIRTYTKPETYEVIMVDNASTDGTREWLQEQEPTGVKVIFNDENVGFPKGCNMGISHAEAGNDILLLNNDIEVTHNWLENLQIALYSDSTIGAVQGLDAYRFHGAKNDDGEVIPFLHLRDTSPIHQFAVKNNTSDPSRWKYTNFLTGYCLLIKRHVLDQVGLLDETFSPGNFEDDDLSFRILAAGYYLLHCYDCFIHHFGSQSFRKDESTYWQLIETNAQKFIAKWGFHAWDKSQHDHQLLRLLEADQQADIHVLHIDCRLGATLFEVKQRYPNAYLYGIDPEGTYTAVIQNLITTRPTLSDFDDQLFDFILIGDTFEKAENPREFLSQVKKQLKPTGHVILNIQNIMHHSVLKNLLTGHWQHQKMAVNPENRTFLTINDIKILFNDCGYINPLIFHWYEPTNEAEDAFIEQLCALIKKETAHLYRTSLHTVRFQKDPHFQDANKVCFITCVNNDAHYEKALNHLHQLDVPKGVNIEKIAIKDAKSMAEGYNRAMKQTDAKYKVYLHQDVFIVNKRFIFDSLALFKQHEKMGMLGVCGAKKMPDQGIWWEADDCYGQVMDSHSGVMKLLQFQTVEADFESVEALDGLILMTQHDVNWREDLFDDFHFYDVSHCMELIRAGYFVAVPQQKEPWVFHDCGVKLHWRNVYERYRNIFLTEYLQKEHVAEVPQPSLSPPKISAVIPTYQGAAHIKRMIDSVFNQTLQDFELVVVIDGSTDETQTILEAYCDQHPNMRFVYQENQGILRAKGRGLKEITGDYVILLDHDDQLDPTTFEKLYHKAIAEDADLVYYGFVGVYQGRRIEYPAIIDPHKFNIAHSPMWSKLIRRDFLSHVDYDDLPAISYDEDYLVSILLAIHNPKIAVVDEQLYYHLPDPTSTSTQLKAYYLDDVMTSYQFLVSTFKKLNLYEAYQSHLLAYLSDVKNFMTPRISAANVKKINAFYEQMKADDPTVDPTKKERKKKFMLYLTGLTDGYFTIDAGIIPFVMEKHHGYDAEIVAEAGEDRYPANAKYTENMKVTIVADKEALHQHLSEADVLFVFGMYEHNLPIIENYRQKNPLGKVYCKLDMNEIWLMRLAQHQWWWTKHFLNQCDLITVECKRLQNLIKCYWQTKVQYIPNGYYNFWEHETVPDASKSNVILTVGRPGDFVKNTDLVLNAFVNIHDQLPDWKLVMVGQYEPEFEKLVQQRIQKLPALKEKISLTGRLNKEDVRAQFKAAKVFCHTSRWEACSNVLAESLGSGCYPIFTDFNGAAGLIKYGEYGTVIPVEDQLALEESLLNICQDEQRLANTAANVQEHAKTTINWITLCAQIDQWLFEEK